MMVLAICEVNGMDCKLCFLMIVHMHIMFHCFAHRLQLALVAASREVIQVHEVFTQLTSIVNIVGVSCKRHDQLQAA